MTEPSFKVALSVEGSYNPSANDDSTWPSVITIKLRFAPSRTLNGIGCGQPPFGVASVSATREWAADGWGVLLINPRARRQKSESKPTVSLMCRIRPLKDFDLR